MRIESGQVAVVTGGGSGIGRALTLAFAARGCSVMIADVADEDAAETVELSAGSGGEIVAAHCDVSDPAAVDALAATTVERFGRVDIVCNNAGVSGGGPIWEFSDADWRFVLGVNLWGVINGVRAFVPRLVQQGHGHVVNTASLAGLVAAPGLGSYTATKHAVVGISETLFQDLRAAGSAVGTSVLCPGFVNTRIYDGDRSRPAELSDPRGSATDPSVTELIRAFFETQMLPEAAARQVLDAIESDRFWILTHPELTPAVLNRFQGMAEGDNPSDLNPFAV